MNKAASTYRYLFDSAYGSANHFIARWIFLRALGLIYFSAFFALLFQVRGLIGSQGILPAVDYLQAVHSLGALRFWYAPTFLWFSSSDHSLMALCWAGLIASLVLVANICPRIMLLVCFVCFLSFVSAAQDFSGYQSDGMLLEAGFLSLFLAPSGIFPGLGIRQRPARAAMFLLLWEWFRIYFESGVVKLDSGDPTWRNLTAMYEYYQNGPLPTWIGWYLQHMPHWFHIATAAATLVMELVLAWMAFLSRPWKMACFFIVTAWQIGVIASANYTFLNYLVLALAVLLLDDAFLQRFLPRRLRISFNHDASYASCAELEEPISAEEGKTQVESHLWGAVRTATFAVVLTWIFYATTLPLVQMFWHGVPLPIKPVATLEPFRIANQYGLFAVMTPHRYEIEFQGSNDGVNWVAYPFRYKPQELKDRPRIYAPYQPRFDWNLWFASLGSWQQNLMVPRTEELLLENDRDVLGLFSGNPFPNAPPRLVRAVLWQYWFSTLEQKHTEGVWWQRQFLGAYAPTLIKLPNGRFGVVDETTLNEPRRR
ncbi:lipase maturation factor family protein [Edaphobacter aggregans]|uniref:lipase maturation factor family protein n=1 Tax=Edaphobacter aggregans TaxID=570835 RepID=UPI00054FA9A8|nr:lipase maturation factor family protein [Edaphobacter aggregans]